MAPIILPGGIVLDPHNAGAQQLQAHAERLGLDDVQGVRATVVGEGRTYLVLDKLRPVFKHPLVDDVRAYLDTQPILEHDATIDENI